jgi:hypothetical protein
MVPSLIQVENFVSRLRKKKTSSEPMTTADLVKYIAAHSALPDNEDGVFVPGFMPYEREHFVVVWSTLKLIDIQHSSNFLATDATYKLTW